MPEIIEFKVGGDPAAKQRATPIVRQGGDGRHYAAMVTGSKTRQWEKWGRAAAEAAMAGRPPFHCPCAVEVRAFFAVPKSWPNWKADLAYNGALVHTGFPDADNITKIAKDCARGVIFADDRLVAGEMARKAFAEIPHVHVIVRAFTEAVPSSIKRRSDAAAILGGQASYLKMLTERK